MKNTSKTAQIKDLRQKAKRNNLGAIACFFGFFFIPLLPIHVLGCGILITINFGAFMACIQTAIEQTQEAETIERRSKSLFF
jgi:hypothetical protein